MKSIKDDDQMEEHAPRTGRLQKTVWHCNRKTIV